MTTKAKTVVIEAAYNEHGLVLLDQYGAHTQTLLTQHTPDWTEAPQYLERMSAKLASEGWRQLDGWRKEKRDTSGAWQYTVRIVPQRRPSVGSRYEVAAKPSVLRVGDVIAGRGVIERIERRTDMEFDGEPVFWIDFYDPKSDESLGNFARVTEPLPLVTWQ